jgi:KDO2-lipid IV(A) lauroyltransferase
MLKMHRDSLYWDTSVDLCHISSQNSRHDRIDTAIPLSNLMNEFTGKLAAFLVRVLGTLPLGIIYPLGAVVGYLLWLAGSRGSRVSVINVGLCYPELDSIAQTNLARQSMIETGKTFLETAAAWSKPFSIFEQRIASAHGEDLFINSIERGNGLILVSSHMGSFEVLMQYIAKFCNPTVLYRPNQLAALDNYVSRQRSRYGAILVPTDKTGITAFGDSLHHKGVIAMAADPEPRLERGSFAPFFNVPALTAHYIIDLLRDTQADILGIHIARDLDYRFHVYIDKFPDTIHSQDMIEALTAMNQVVEARVRDHPTQYQWGYKRFKRRPNGEKLYI